MFKEIGSLKKGTKTEERLVSGIVRHTKHFSTVCHLIWAQFVGTQNNCNSNLKGHWLQITIANIIMKKSEIV